MSMVSWFHRFRGVIGFVVFGFIGFGFRGVNGFIVS